MLKENHKSRIVISFGVAVFFILFTLVSSWNAFADDKEKLGFWPLFGGIVAIGALSELFRLSYKLADTDTLDEYVKLQVAEGKAQILAEIKKKEETENGNEDGSGDNEEVLKQIIPSGNFKNIESFGKKLLVNLANSLNLVQGVFYIFDKDKEQYVFASGYALNDKYRPESFKAGENINGQVAADGAIMVVEEIPADYLAIESGLGDAQPGVLYVVPIIKGETTIGIVELASFKTLEDNKLKILEQVADLSSTKIDKIVKA